MLNLLVVFGRGSRKILKRNLDMVQPDAGQINIALR